MLKLTIIEVYNSVIVFKISEDLYYLRSDLPALYDSGLNRMFIPNIDFWLQNHTQQRYNYRSLLDMAEAFTSGKESGFTSTEFVNLINRFMLSICEKIFRPRYAYKFIEVYWIECLGPAKLRKALHVFTENFDTFLNKLGHTVLFQRLCRFNNACIDLDMLDEAHAFHALINKLNMHAKRNVFISSAVPFIQEVTSDVMSTIEKEPEFSKIDSKVLYGIRQVLNNESIVKRYG